MPAVTAPDPTALPKLDTPSPEAKQRRVSSLTTAPHDFEGLGFPVRRVFAGVDLAALDPFIHLDEMGEVEYAPGEAKGTAWHPHRGFETVTYMIDGTMQHADSTGGGGSITNGDTQWMTAGSGLLHIEAPPEELVASGGVFHGLQLWVNLPAAKKWSPPRYQPIAGSAVTLLASQDGGVQVRLIAGAIGDHVGPGATHTPITMIHASFEPGSRVQLPWPTNFNALVYALNGRGRVGRDAHAIDGGQLAVLTEGDTISIDTGGATTPLEIVVLGGQPIGEPVAWYGPFVMNTDDEIRQALDDYRAGRLGTAPD